MVTGSKKSGASLIAHNKKTESGGRKKTESGGRKKTESGGRKKTESGGRKTARGPSDLSAVDVAEYDFAIVGGGFFGTYLSWLLKTRVPGSSVVVFEQEDKLFTRASYNNQARVHQGYHYPRSVLTALRSHKNFDRFVREFAPCVVKDFEKYYAIGKLQSKVTARQYELFCDRIGMPVRPAPKRIKALFDPRLIEDVFAVKEYAFDSDKLAAIMSERMREAGVDVMMRTRVESLHSDTSDGKNTSARQGITIRASKDGSPLELRASNVFLCTYANLNTILHRSGIELLDLRHEMTEMALVELPKEMRDISVTVMCGPFFSFMPFPPKGLFTLSHVRYTPHHEWRDKDGYVDNQKYYEECMRKKKLSTSFPRMIKDVSRYMPCAENFKYKGSIWEIKTILPRSDDDDSRPILFKRDVGGVKNLYCILGGKIDNVYDLEGELGKMLGKKTNAKAKTKGTKKVSEKR